MTLLVEMRMKVKKKNEADSMKKDEKIRHYLVANRSTAVVYQEGDSPEDLLFVYRLKNPTGRMQEIELVSDRPGRTISGASGGTMRNGMTSENSQHEESAKDFAREISKRLIESSAAGEFKELVLVAEPHFLGLLRAALPKSIQTMVHSEIAKEYAEGSDKEIGLRIAQRLNERKGTDAEERVARSPA